MWFRTKQGIKYKVNDEFIGVKMTREEAVGKIVVKNCASRMVIDDVIDVLEALGLIKFEEKVVPSPSSLIALVASDKNINTPFIFADECVNKLMQYGYKIVLK